MDPGTAQIISALIGAVLSLATLVINTFILRRTQETHDLVNGMSHETAALHERAAGAEGELKGRDTPLAPPTSPAGE